MSEIAWEILIISGLILLNGVFALAEIAIVASQKARLQRMADRGSQRAKAALQIAESPADFLSTVQVGITLVGILSGTFAGATIAEQLASYLSGFPAIAPYAETIALAVVVMAITYLSLIVGGLVPKRIALSDPRAHRVSRGTPDAVSVEALITRGLSAGRFNERGPLAPENTTKRRALDHRRRGPDTDAPGYTGRGV